MRIFLCHHVLVAGADFIPRFPALEFGQVARIFHVNDNIAEDVLVKFHSGVEFKK
jgi:hypothetical protein